MYYQINAIMEKKKYEEKPSVVVVDKVVDQIYGRLKADTKHTRRQ